MYIASSRDSGKEGPKRNWAKRVQGTRQLQEELRNLIMFELGGNIEVLKLTRNEVSFRSTILKCWDIVEYIGSEEELLPFHNIARCVSEIRIHTQSTKMAALNTYKVPAHIFKMFAGTGNMDQLLRAALPAVILNEFTEMQQNEKDYYYEQLYAADIEFLAELAVNTFYSANKAIVEDVVAPNVTVQQTPLKYVGFKAVA